MAWLAGALGIAGLVRAFRRQPEPFAQPLPEPGPDPRADELRRRLDEAKPLAAEPLDEADAAETTVDRAPDPPPAPPPTREDVHARARAAIDQMRRSGEDA